MIRVGVVDDHPVFRQGLAHAVEGAEGLELVFALASVEDFDSRGETPDLVILDLGLPGMHGANAVRHVCERGSKVLVVSAEGSQADVLDAIAACASGYLTKSAEPNEITAAVHIVASGETYVSPTLAACLLRAAKQDQARGSHVLTAREREILALLAAGERDSDIAEQLFISVRTVRSHLDRIRDKTGRRRRADLTRLAVEQGIVPPETPPV
ncbi:MAG: two-component system, NarL family, nitrate/nitrite response regulator NarL [Actinomycetota bacterium]|nr:two-component system, NarL family, nitrate/nitrite response regulator NarL [Actinomycetota bacterium]